MSIFEAGISIAERQNLSSDFDIPCSKLDMQESDSEALLPALACAPGRILRAKQQGPL